MSVPRALLLAASLVVSCTPPVFRQTTAADARPPDRWLEGERCGSAPAGDVRVEVVEDGIGGGVGAGQTVRVQYVARSATGETLHDTRPGAPHEMVIGSTRMICGFEKGLLGMRPGEQRRVFVPWQLAFGEDGRPPDIQPRTDLVFVIDLFLPAAADSSPGASPGRPAPASRRR